MDEGSWQRYQGMHALNVQDRHLQRMGGATCLRGQPVVNAKQAHWASAALGQDFMLIKTKKQNKKASFFFLG